MSYSGFILVICIVNSCLQTTLCSYLGYPRIHFAGRFRADSNFQNNNRCNYCKDSNNNHSTRGSNEFEFVNSAVTSVVYSNGTRSLNDKLVGKSIISNLDRPYAKIVDLDVACQLHSTVYGMKFGIKWEKIASKNDIDNVNVAIYGDWTPNIITQSMWTAVKCYNKKIYGMDNQFSSQSTTTITNIDWSNIGNSEIIRELQRAVGDGSLAARITLYFYVDGGSGGSLGSVVGVIGVSSPRDTLNVPGSRVITSVTNSPPIGINYNECGNQTEPPWVNTAPVEVDYEMGEVHIDLSNSIPRNNKNSMLNVGNLQLGVLIRTTNNRWCVHLLGESYIPYQSDIEFPITSGVHTVRVNSDYLMLEIQSSPLVLVQVVDIENGGTEICYTSESYTAVILLQELTPFVRPKDYYVDRLDRVTKPSTSMTFYVTEYGNPVANSIVQVSPFNHYNVITSGPRQPVLPENGIAPTSWRGITNKDGLVSFEFKLNTFIPLEREYKEHNCSDCGPIPCPKSVCTIPIDGQVYYFNICVRRLTGDDTCQDPLSIRAAMLAFSDYTYASPPTWVNHVGPIFSMYARISPIMKKILDMSSYVDVSKPDNIELLKKTFALDFNDPSYMPTMRDLSPIKQYMITEWLEYPLYDDNSYIPAKVKPPVCYPLSNVSITPPSPPFSDPRCQGTLHLKEHPNTAIPYYKDIFMHNFYTRVFTDKEVGRQSSYFGIKGRPLFGTAQKRIEIQNYINPFNGGQPVQRHDHKCTLETLQHQLQIAMELEWATIPLYLTSLYSILPGCNVEIYKLILDVVMQEMLHFTLAANMIIALGGPPTINTATFTPSYPSYLPGSVLPSLRVSLKKLSLSHVYQTFMAIELPQETEVGGDIDTDLFTIGTFYDEIKDCIKQLRDEQYPGEDIFDASTAGQQVLWSGWDSSSNVGELHPIVDTDSALKAIDVIVSQGEGSSPMNPTDSDQNKLAHFFKFEEMVCQRHLIMLDEEHYAYMGRKIEFNPNGVAPMRDNPRVSTLIPNTRCYTEAKIFHGLYRKFLRKLQEVFNGKPSEIFTSIQLMESLLVHAKRLMLIPYNPDNPADETICGPVWDYNWPNQLTE